MSRRAVLGASIPAVLLFVGLLFALMIPANRFVLTEASDRLGLLGARRRMEGLVRDPAAVPAGPLLLVNGRLWDAREGPRPNPGLAMEGGRIVAQAPPGATAIDVTGMTVLPGLIDMHVHAVGGSFADEMMIGSGVTTARDLGTHLEGVLARRETSWRGAAAGHLGPRLLVSGPYLVGGDASGDQEVPARDPAEAQAVVSRFADAGVDGVKLHWGVGRETLHAAVEAAHRRGLWVAAHLDGVGAEEAARLGVSTVEHASGIDWDDPDPELQESARREMIRLGVFLTPTLVVSEHAFTLPDLARGGSPALEYFPWILRRGWITGQMANASANGLTSDEIGRRRARLARTQDFVRRFHAAGGRVLAGTDAPAYLVAPGLDIHRELELLVGSGLTPEQALACATNEAARALGLAGELGGLTPGLRADALVVAGDPLSDPEGITATRRVAMVIQDGRIVVDRRR